MTPEAKARQAIDKRLEQSGWIIQDMREVNPMAAPGVAVREYPTSTGPVDYALFVDGRPVGVVEAKRDDEGENITAVETQSGRYAGSTFKYVSVDYRGRVPPLHLQRVEPGARILRRLSHRPDRDAG